MRTSFVVDLCPVSLKSPCSAFVTQQAKLWLVWSHVCAGSSAGQCCCWSEVMPEISQASHWTECVAAAFQLPASKAAEFLKWNVKPLFLGGDSLSAIAEVAGEWQVVRYGGRKGFFMVAGERRRKPEIEALVREKFLEKSDVYGEFFSLLKVSSSLNGSKMEIAMWNVFTVHLS